MNTRTNLVAAIALALSIGSCVTKSADSGEPKLKLLLSRTDVVLVKHFYPASATVTEVQDEKYKAVVPGQAVMSPLWVYEPSRETEGQKGARVETREGFFVGIGGIKNGGREAVCYLDLSELNDLESALAYFLDPKNPWRSGTKSDHVEVDFHAKDEFAVSAFHASDGNDTLAIKVRNTSIYAPFSRAATLRDEVHKTIEVLNGLK